LYYYIICWIVQATRQRAMGRSGNELISPELDMEKLTRRGLHEHVIDEIGRSILCGEFSPGMPLPSEADLCRTLSVSRTALREALRVLAAKGLVEAKPKVGTLVRAREHWNFLDADILAWRLRGHDSDRVVSELYELRHLIEPIAASLAARNAKEAEVELLREAYRDMQAAGDDGAKIAEPDLKFHRTIIRASGNHMFASLAHVLGAALSANFDLVSDAPRGHRHSMPGHKKVLDAIAAGNSSAARVAMQNLIEDSQRDARAVNNRRETTGISRKSRRRLSQ
jgi:DNA-binding FadR family transcriptional regulator